MASLRRSATTASVSPVACVDVDEHTRSTGAPSAWASCSIDLATSILYSCRWPLSPSKSRSTWNPVTRSPLARTAAMAAGSPSGWPTTSRADSMTCVNPAARMARSLASSGPASVMVSMPKSVRRIGGPPLGPEVTLDELERHAAGIELGERATISRPDRPTVDEDDPARLQRGYSRRHRGRAQPDAQQAFVPRDVGGVVRRLDQLQEERPARALQQHALVDDAEELAA